MGVKKYYNQYRAAVHLFGEPLQVYFDAEEAAEAFVSACKEKNLEGQLGYTFRSMRSDKRDTSLPVGIFDSIPRVRVYSNGRTAKPCIAAHIKLPNDRRRASSVQYSDSGKPRTREEAIQKALAWRNGLIVKWVMENKES